MTPEEHRAEPGAERGEYTHRGFVYVSPEVDRGLPAADVSLVWCPDNDWDPADPYGTDTPVVHALVVDSGNGDGYAPQEARQLADRLVRAAEAIREAGVLLEAGVQ